MHTSKVFTFLHWMSINTRGTENVAQSGGGLSFFAISQIGFSECKFFSQLGIKSTTILGWMTVGWS